MWVLITDVVIITSVKRISLGVVAEYCKGGCGTHIIAFLALLAKTYFDFKNLVKCTHNLHVQHRT